MWAVSRRRVSSSSKIWDSLALDVLRQASDPGASADLAVVLMQEGLANILLVGKSMTSTRSRIETSIPRKHGPAIAGYESALKKFFENVLQAFLKHVDFNVVRCAVIASPGFTKRYDALSKIPDHPTQMIVFFSLPSVARLEWAYAKTLVSRKGTSQVAGIVGSLGFPFGPRPLRDVISFVQRYPPIFVRTRSFSADSGELVDAVVPFMGESITDGTLASFLKHPGDRVEVDEPIAQIETDKVTIDVSSPEAGVLEQLVAKVGDTVEPGTKIAVISKSGGVTHVAPSEDKPSKEASEPCPAKAKKVETKKPKAETPPSKEKPTAPSLPPPKPSAKEPQLPPKERERRVPMTRLRKRVATRLKDSQNTFAMLTTFNEVDMTSLMKLRSDYKDAFFKKHGVKLGLMSGFVKAAVSALQNQPIVNAVIDGDDIIYRDYIDISIAVGTPKGLVVPVIRNADRMNFAEIEKGINILAKKANDGSLSIDEMAGGSFTISNGGVYGSLLSTPIINPPQSAILGMHSIVSRPMVVSGEVVPRPMMYIALTYDHRLIDGREAVFFLRRIKDVVEDPRRLLLDV